jgi:arylsulfatase A-like enzyme
MNGVPLTELEITGTPAPHDVLVPAAFWQRGRNQLDFDVLSPTAQLSVSSLAISPAEEIRTDKESWLLGPHTEAGWPLELASSALLDYELSAPAPGALKLQLHERDRLSGATRVLTERVLELTPGTPASGRLQLPAPGTKVLEVRLAWEPEDSTTPMSLTRLELFEEHPLARPPILFLSIDTLAAQNLSVYGYGRETTPNLKRLAEDSILFQQMRSNAPWTVPSYASQFTGLYALSNRRPKSTTATKPLAWQLYSIRDERWSLSELAESAGYRTAAIVDNLLLARISGISRGFEIFDAEPAGRDTRDPEGGMRLVLPRALELLDQDAERPPFVFAQIFDVHAPYFTNEPFKGTFADTLPADATGVMPIVRTEPAIWTGIPKSMTLARFKQADVPTEFGAEYLRADYDEKILELDDSLGEFLASLKERGLYDDLLIVFTADHGESMVDHDFNFRHGLDYDSAIHVPFMIKLPGGAHAGETVSAPVQLVDLYPTLAELIGLPTPLPYVHGRSLVPALEGQELAETPIMTQADIIEHCSLVHGRWKLLIGSPARTAWASLLSPPTYQQRLYDLAPDLFALLLGSPPLVAPERIIALVAELQEHDKPTLWRIKRLIKSTRPLVELYGIESDPMELQNLAAEQPEVVNRLLQQMLAERARATAVRTTDVTNDVAVSEEMLEELRRLGYLGDD